MTLLEVVLISLVEGITEFIPISSTFHILLTAKLLGVEQSNFFETFAIAIQGGAILAVFTMFGKEYWSQFSLLFKISLSFVVTAIFGLALESLLQGQMVDNQWVLVISFVVMGAVFLFIEFLIKRKMIVLDKNLGSLDTKMAILIGLAQVVSIVPGVSRAGVVIAVMMLLRFTRVDAAKYSFMLAVPTLLAAGGVSLWSDRQLVLVEPGGVLIIVTGLVVSFFASYFSLKYLIKYLQTRNLIVFGMYRIIVGIILLVLLLSGVYY